LPPEIEPRRFTVLFVLLPKRSTPAAAPVPSAAPPAASAMAATAVHGTAAPPVSRAGRFDSGCGIA